MDISLKEFNLLQELQRYPLITYSDLAKKLGCSITTVRKYLDKLMASEQEEIITTSKKKETVRLRTSPLQLFTFFQYEKLNLFRSSFLLEAKNQKSIDRLVIFCEHHPYTSFRAQLHGGMNGIYIVFYSPLEIIDQLHVLFNFLKEKKKIVDFKEIISLPSMTIRTKPDISLFNPETSKWDFNFESFCRYIENIELKNESFQHPPRKSNDFVLHDLCKLDIMILREWGYGAGLRKTHREILNNITTESVYRQNSDVTGKIDRYVISERVNFLMDLDIINHCAIAFNREKISLFNRIFYVGKAKANFLLKLAKTLDLFNFPFSSIFTLDSFSKRDESVSFSWWIDIPPKELSKLTRWIFGHTETLETYLVSTKTIDVENYPIYHENIVISEKPEPHHWNADHNYCSLDPISVIISKEELKEFKQVIKNSLNK